MSIKDITIGRYIHGTSLLHSLDPRTKILSLLAVATGLFSGDSYTALCIVTLYAMTACVFSGLQPGYLLKSLLPFKWLIIVTVILNVLFVGGHILIEAPLPYGGITREGLDAGILYGGRIALLVFIASLLTLTTEPVVLVDGVEKMIRPLKKLGLKPHEIAIAMVITIRFIPILLDEAEKIRKSHIARGLRPDGSLKERLQSVSMLFLPLFHSALRRAETLALAMDCRLYRGGAERTRYMEMTMASKDWGVLTASIAVAAGMLFFV